MPYGRMRRVVRLSCGQYRADRKRSPHAELTLRKSPDAPPSASGLSAIRWMTSSSAADTRRRHRGGYREVGIAAGRRTHRRRG